MTLEETIRTLEAVALQQQSVAMVIDNDIFKLNTIPNAKYAVFAYTQGEHLTSVSGDLATYRLTLFYVDRLLADKSNQTEIQSTGTQVLRNILTMMSELDFQVDNMPIQPFTQQFVDECAGVYCSVAIGAANGCECMPGFSDVLRKLNAATDKANEAADRANALADNPPKIVLNDQGYFWAFYDLETKQYVTSQYRADVGDAVLFSAQELNAEQQTQVQTNIGVKNAVDVIGAGDIRTIDIGSEKQSDGFRNKVGVIESSSDYFYTNPIPVNKGDVVLLNNTFAATNVMPIAEVSSDNTFVKAMSAGITGVHDYHAVARGGYISLCVAKDYIKGTQAFIIPCKLAQAISEPAGGYNRQLYESYGAVYNEKTGFYELNGFTDITEEEMWNIYRYFNFNDMAMFVGRYPYDGANLKVRTNIPFQSAILNSGSISFFRITHKWAYLCSTLRYVEKIVISRRPEDIYLCADNYIGCNYLLYGCDSLVEVEGVIDFSKYEGNLTYVLSGCPKLKSFKLIGLHNNATFNRSPSINLGTLAYVIENATNTKAITITVDPTIYGYLTGTTQPAPETGGTAEEWQALVTTAQEKQISFASA